MAERMVVIQGDITRQAVDAIVNAANERLRWQGTIPAGAGLLEVPPAGGTHAAVTIWACVSPFAGWRRRLS